MIPFLPAFNMRKAGGQTENRISADVYALSRRNPRFPLISLSMTRAVPSMSKRMTMKASFFHGMPIANDCTPEQ
jgi:hypothetical protein